LTTTSSQRPDLAAIAKRWLNTWKVWLMIVPKKEIALIEILNLLDGWIGKYHEIRLISICGYTVPKKYQFRRRKKSARRK